MKTVGWNSLISALPTLRSLTSSGVK